MNGASPTADGDAATSLDGQAVVDRLIEAGGVDADIGQWITADPDPITRQELLGIVSRNLAEARLLFADRIRFGTAGLRAPMGPGPMQMNRLVVRQTTLGLLRWLTESKAGPVEDVRIVVGYDARHRSRQFADEVVNVVAAFGGQALVISKPCPTPVLALSVLDQSASAGVMITASHNPATDNGYKLYLDDGIQLSAPVDTEIAEAIDEVAAEMGEPNGTSLAAAAALVSNKETIVLDAEPFEAHEKAVVGLLASDQRSVRILYTPVHGVGGTQA